MGTRAESIDWELRQMAIYTNKHLAVAAAQDEANATRTIIIVRKGKVAGLGTCYMLVPHAEFHGWAGLIEKVCTPGEEGG